MADVEEMLDGVPVRLAPAQAVRARGERRRARQRVGMAAVVVVVATAVGIGSWTDLTPGPRGSQVASQGENPFMSHGVVQHLQPSDLPRNADLHWKIDNELSGSDASPALPEAGLGQVCNGRPGGIEEPDQQFTSTYTGKGDAKARYRVSQYATSEQALDAIRGLGQTLSDCGLKERKDGGYSGRTNGNGPLLDVGVRRWGAWVGVVEAQYSPTS